MRFLSSDNPDRVHRTSHSHVVHKIGQSIVSGEYPVGSILPGDKELAERFDVSRTVLREAMKTLSAKGMVVAKARVGTRVTDRKQWNLFDADILEWYFESGIPKDFLTHLSEVRLAFEPFAAGLAAEHATDADIIKLFELAEAMGGPSHTPETIAQADLAFHLAVLDASQNPFMRSVGSLIQAALTSMFKLSSPTEDIYEVEEVSETHKRIAEAIQSRDPSLAAKTMENVIVLGQRRVSESNS